MTAHWPSAWKWVNTKGRSSLYQNRRQNRRQKGTETRKNREKKKKGKEL